MEEDMGIVARQGRQLQRYNRSGGRLVAGCIPYKFDANCSSSGLLDSMEVLVISSQKGDGMMFPKGGWESDETIKQAASREALEEAGVQGNVERRLGMWKYSTRLQTINEGVMFPLNVTEELIKWPEMGARKRRWVSVAEARKGCTHQWMKEALDRLVRRLSTSIRRRRVCRRQKAVSSEL
ncbi:nudix hydrolase 17, mitochondrial-like [Phalaenopsis equestris]|uniref:nudix hydrolase 17, mitochondrial-like n=1 Tax=Phalaenopsis equestris TaxID=78828 RepID=UPI0009E312F6|nr:nudix hydrolase 17, mitochondrial-like [Phalaenopsis equestris]